MARTCEGCGKPISRKAKRWCRTCGGKYKRPTQIITCGVCGRSIVKAGPALYCSVACRMRAARVRQGEPLRERERARNRARKRWLTEDPAKKRARNKVMSAVRYGKLERQPCEVCGDPKSQAHHEDYTKPLDVRWLCRTHHELEHHPRQVAA